LQRRDRRARLDELADVDARNAERAGERRGELLLVEYRFQLGDLSDRRCGGGLRLLDAGLGADAAPLQFERALQVLLVELGGGALRREVGLLLGVVELYQKRALLDALVRLEGDVLDHAGGFNGQVDAARRADG